MNSNEDHEEVHYIDEIDIDAVEFYLNSLEEIFKVIEIMFIYLIALIFTLLIFDDRK